MNGGLAVAWMGSIGLVTWRAFTKNHRPPAPSELAATAVVYGTLGLASGDAARPAAVLGWGLLIAGLLNLYDPTLQTGPFAGQGAREAGQKVASRPTGQAGQNIAQAGRLV